MPPIVEATLNYCTSTLEEKTQVNNQSVGWNEIPLHVKIREIKDIPIIP